MGRKNSDCRKGGGVAVELYLPSSVTNINMRQLVPWLSRGGMRPAKVAGGKKVPEQRVEGEYPCFLWKGAPEEGMLTWSQKE